MWKEKVEDIKEEDRKIRSEHDSMARQIEHSNELIETLEREKRRLEGELKRYTKDDTKSAIIEAELHTRKALHSIGDQGASQMRQIYAMNTKTKGTMTSIRNVNIDL